MPEQFRCYILVVKQKGKQLKGTVLQNNSTSLWAASVYPGHVVRRYEWTGLGTLDAIMQENLMARISVHMS